MTRYVICAVHKYTLINSLSGDARPQMSKICTYNISIHTGNFEMRLLRIAEKEVIEEGGRGAGHDTVLKSPHKEVQSSTKLF